MFKVSTELAEIRAVVTDQHGHIVEDLKKEDFELLEDGQPQEISFFTVSRWSSQMRQLQINANANREYP